MSGPRTSVLMVAEQLRRTVPGGIGTYARGVLQGLDDGGAGDPPLEVTLLASRPRRRVDGDRAGEDPLARLGRPLRVSPLPGPLLTRAWDHGLVHAPDGFDVLHAASLAFPRPHRRRPVPFCVTVHDLSWRTHPEAATRRGRRWHEASLLRALRSAQAFVVPSDAVAGELVAAGAPAPAVAVVSGGTDHLPPPDTGGAASLLRGVGVPGEFVLTVGTAEPRKNLGRLLAAYALARPRLAGVPLVVVGPSGWGDAGTDRPPAGVVLVGLVPDPVLAGLYALARAFVYVPLIEGYGLPPLEAMTFGVPVVASRGVPSVVPRGGEPPDAPALVVDAFDVDDIADGLAAAVAETRQGPVARAGQRLAAGRTWRRAAGLHAELWRAVARAGA